MRRLLAWTLLVLLGLSACAKLPAQMPTETVSPLSMPEPDPVILESTPTPEPTATEKFIPKHNDLIFVEFFAVT